MAGVKESSTLLKMDKRTRELAESHCKHRFGMGLRQWLLLLVDHYAIMAMMEQGQFRVIGSYYRGRRHYIVNQDGVSVVCPCNSGNACLLNKEDGR